MLRVSIAVYAGIILWLSLSIGAADKAKSPSRDLARYEFEEQSSFQITDSSGNGRHGQTIGGGGWSESGMLFTGVNRVRVPSNQRLDAVGAVTATAWIRGRGEPVRWMPGLLQFRSGHFQVVGDRIFTATDTQILSAKELEKLVQTQQDTSSGRKYSNANDIWQLWTGEADTSFLSSRAVKRLRPPFGALEPKLQVVGNEVHLEYFGHDENGNFQIWTAIHDTEGRGWNVARRTNSTIEGGVEQSNGIQVVGNRVYFGFPQKDKMGRWQLWTASYRRDGSEFAAVQRTINGGWIPAVQVSGKHVYYMFVQPEDSERIGSHGFSLKMARTSLDGENWELLRDLGRSHWLGPGWGSFYVSNNKIWFIFQRQDSGALRHTRLLVGSMKVDGTDYAEADHSLGSGFHGIPNSALQVVGGKIHYVYTYTATDKSHAAFYEELKQLENMGRMGTELWAATSDIDGGGWTTEPLTRGMADTVFSYKGLQIVGAKQYLSAMQFVSTGMMAPIFGTTGGTVVGKGDAFGIGISSSGRLRGFINAGTDYLVQGEAPIDSSGAIAETEIDSSWHHVAMTYDGRALCLYVDGAKRANTDYVGRIRSLPLPLIIGDGFQGLIRDVRLFDRALTSGEVRDIYNQSARR